MSRSASWPLLSVMSACLALLVSADKDPPTEALDAYHRVSLDFGSSVSRPADRRTGSSAEPTTALSNEPTTAPSDKPTDTPADEPTGTPSDEPTTAPSDEPSISNSDEATTAPSDEPTISNSDEPTTAPSDEPTGTPSDEPTFIGQTREPTASTASSDEPTSSSGPSGSPSSAPSTEPSEGQSDEPTTDATDDFSAFPSGEPTTSYSDEPTTSNSNEPTTSNSNEPTTSNSDEPTGALDWWGLLEQHRMAFRTCMISANYITADTDACDAELRTAIQNTDLSKSGFDVESGFDVFVEDQKISASFEEESERYHVCDLNDCSTATCPVKPCETCTACQAEAVKYANLVRNIESCGSSCTSEQSQTEAVNQAEQQHDATLEEMITAMETCITPDSTDDEIAVCKQGQYNASGVDNQEDFEYQLEEAVENAVEAAMYECSAKAGVDYAELKKCDEDAKGAAATALGIKVADVSDAQVMQLKLSASKLRASQVMEACMTANQGVPAEQAKCSQSSSVKDSIAAILGVDASTISVGYVLETVAKAGIVKLVANLDSCMKSIDSTLSTDTQSALQTTCRTNTVCRSLETTLGMATGTMSAQECQEHIQASEAKQVGKKIKACSAAVTESDPETAAAARCACKDNSARPALARMQGVEASTISSAEMEQHAIGNLIQYTIPEAMDACVSAVDTDDSLTATEKASSKAACRETNAKTAFSEAMCREPTDTELGMVLDEAQATRVRQALTACKKVAESEREACQADAKSVAASANGQPDITVLEYTEAESAGANQAVVEAAKACATLALEGCDFTAAFAAASSYVQSSRREVGSTTINRVIGMMGAKAHMTTTLQACQSKGDATARLSCNHDLAISIFTSITGSTVQFDAVVRDALEGLASAQVKSCTASGDSFTVCKDAAITAWQLFSIETISDTDFKRAMIVARLQQITTAIGSSTGISCGSDEAACLRQAGAQAATYGGTAQAISIETSFNALRRAASIYSNCKDTNVVCLEEAGTEYADVGGNPGLWEAVHKNEAIEIGDALTSGVLTTMIWQPSVDLTLSFDEACSAISSNVAYDFVVQQQACCPTCTPRQVIDPWTSGSTCQFNYQVYIPDGFTTAVATCLGAITISSNGRRSTASTGSGQTVIECVSCTPSPTPAPAELLQYLLSLDASLFDEQTVDGPKLRQSLVRAYAQTASLDLVDVALGKLQGQDRRSSSTLVGFATSSDVPDNLNELMTGGNFARAFINLAAAQGITIPMFTVTVYTEGGTDATQSSGDFDTWFYVVIGAGSFIFIAAIVAGFIIYRRHQSAGGALADADAGLSPRDEMLLAPSTQGTCMAPGIHHHYPEDVPKSKVKHVNVDMDRLDTDDIELEDTGIAYERFAPA